MRPPSSGFFTRTASSPWTFGRWTGASPPRKEAWNSIYASFRGRSALSGRIIGADPPLHERAEQTESNPVEGAELRRLVGSRRFAVIAGKYGGGVFGNLPDGTVCMCNYSYQHEDSDFQAGDSVTLVVQRLEQEKQQMYGKI